MTLRIPFIDGNSQKRVFWGYCHILVLLLVLKVIHVRFDIMHIYISSILDIII